VFGVSDPVEEAEFIVSRISGKRIGLIFLLREMPRTFPLEENAEEKGWESRVARYILHSLKRRKVMKRVNDKVQGERFLSLATMILLLGVTAFSGAPLFAASGADYPSKPVLFFALSTPGSGFDTTTRAIVNTLTKEKLVTVPMPVENATNASQGLAMTVTRYKGDPYMISVQSINGMMRYATGASPYYHKDYLPLAGLISTYYGIAVRMDSPYKTLGDLVKDLKERPEKTPICGGGSDDRPFYGATFMKAGVDINKIIYVVYSGGAETSMAILEGSSKAAINSVDEQLGLVEGKKIRLLAVSSPKRYTHPALKDVPTLKESGIDLEWANMRYTFAGPDFPDYAKKYWLEIFTKMVKTPTWQQTISRYQWDDAFMIEGLKEALDKKQAIVTDVLTKLGMTPKK
jgi:putative tricarboxylic transport membrane protein